MSQLIDTLDSPQAPDVDIDRGSASIDFDYRPVPMLAPVSLFFGFCSFVTLFTVFALPVALFGTLIGGLALRQISKAKGDLGGRLLTIVGLGASAFFLVTGTALHGYMVATEVPEGFERIHFATDIAKKGFIYEDGLPRHHGDVAALDGRKVFLKGYMYPTQQTENLTTFILVKDNQQCCFGGQPELTDMILVRMQNDSTADFSTGLVSVAGTFRVGDPRTGGNLRPVYFLDATFFSRSRTPF